MEDLSDVGCSHLGVNMTVFAWEDWGHVPRLSVSLNACKDKTKWVRMAGLVIGQNDNKKGKKKKKGIISPKDGKTFGVNSLKKTGKKILLTSDSHRPDCLTAVDEYHPKPSDWQWISMLVDQHRCQHFVRKHCWLHCQEDCWQLELSWQLTPLADAADEENEMARQRVPKAPSARRGAIRRG